LEQILLDILLIPRDTDAEDLRDRVFCGRPPDRARDEEGYSFVVGVVLLRLCRDAVGSDTRHLGMWSVGRGEEVRLLCENML
jgi:hypothetical protein